jgi:hypothetical protein
MSRFGFALVGAGFVLFSLCLIALAHTHGPGSWINTNKLLNPQTGESCCNEQDCFAEQVDEFPDFVLVRTGEMIPSANVIWRSQDGQWWRCRKYVNGQQSTRCLIGPPKGL